MSNSIAPGPSIGSTELKEESTAAAAPQSSSLMLRPARLDDRYRLERGAAYISGTQALVRLLLNQSARDRAAGLNTGGFVSGYRGSPLSGLDQVLWGIQKQLKEQQIEFIPGLNEDLAATACWGTQQLMQHPEEATVDGVFAMWYGKGPGVDRSGDALKHANAAGTSPHGGALVLAADDHTAKSSSFAHQSEQLLVASFIPILYPSNVQEYLDYGIHGWAMSRVSGLWVGLKCVGDIVESTSIADVDPFRVECLPPQDFKATENVHIRWPDSWPTQEPRIVRTKLPLALSYCRANGLNRIVAKGAGARIGIIAAGKPYNDVREALRLLGIGEQELAAKGIALLKLGMVWPLEPQIIREFAQGLDEIFVVEEKRALIEQQVKDILYPLAASGEKAPQVVGKSSGGLQCAEFEIPAEQRLLRGDYELGPAEIAAALQARLHAMGLGSACQALAAAPGKGKPLPPLMRTPYFCSGCPHNSSTKVPEGSRATAGIGCHYMANWMDRRTESYTHMGGEGAPWVGQSRFSKRPHMFANMGDGTFFHSGSLSIRQAVAAKTPITFKILFNDATALTGGQPHDGPLTAPMLTQLLHAEGVTRVVVVSDDIEKYTGHESAFAPGTTFHHRRDLDAVQRELRELPSVTALVYDQTCAAEKRRRRKRNKYPDPSIRYVINPEVCEGCGDCTVKSNCVSIEPLETPLGRKRQINQSACNKDYSCADGFCPSFVAVEGGSLRKKPVDAAAGDPAAWPEPAHPQLPALHSSYAVLVNGIGGTGVLTIGNILGMAAHLQGLHCSVMDMAGLAQKGGAVWSHVRIAASDEGIHSPRIPDGAADALIGGDLVVSAHPDSVSRLKPDCRAIVNTNTSPTSDFQRDRDFNMPQEALWAGIEQACEAKNLAKIPAHDIAVRYCGDSVYANMILLGAAWQAGQVPLSLDALHRAIELNGQAVQANLRAFRIGRQFVASPDKLVAKPAAVVQWIPRAGKEDLLKLLENRRDRLVAYQGSGYAKQYEDFLQTVRVSGGAKLEGYEEAIARNLFKLMAYKDEYEVARLHSSPELRKLIESQFDGEYKIQFSLAPPLFARKGSDGLPRKQLYGGWMESAFGGLAKLKFLRGTLFDPFGYTHERRTERALIEEYRTAIRTTLPFVAANPKKCLELARIPEQIRGFGHVKAAAIDEARKRQRSLVQEITGKNLPPEAPSELATNQHALEATS